MAFAPCKFGIKAVPSAGMIGEILPKTARCLRYENIKVINVNTPHDMGSNTPGRHLKTVNTTVDVLQALVELDGAGVTELADYLDLSKAAVHNHLTTLQANRMAVKDGTTYRLGLRFVTLGEYVKHQSQLYEAGTGPTDGLARETGEYAHLMTEEHGRGIHIYKSRGSEAVAEDYHHLNLERPDYLHYSAAGKAVLAHLPEEWVDFIVEEYGLPARTEHTITDSDELREELAEIRERGYALNDEEEIVGLRAVGAPILASDGHVLGAISVSGPTSRMKGDTFREQIPEQVIEAANIIELNIETSNT